VRIALRHPAPLHPCTLALSFDQIRQMQPTARVLRAATGFVADELSAPASRSCCVGLVVPVRARHTIVIVAAIRPCGLPAGHHGHLRRSRSAVFFYKRIRFSGIDSSRSEFPVMLADQIGGIVGTDRPGRTFAESLYFAASAGSPAHSDSK
jgi:hypothetical protein